MKPTDSEAAFLKLIAQDRLATKAPKGPMPYVGKPTGLESNGSRYLIGAGGGSPPRGKRKLARKEGI